MTRLMVITITILEQLYTFLELQQGSATLMQSCKSQKRGNFTAAQLDLILGRYLEFLPDLSRRIQRSAKSGLAILLWRRLRMPFHVSIEPSQTTLESCVFVNYPIAFSLSESSLIKDLR